MTYVAQMTREESGEWVVFAFREFPTWAEAFAWLDERRTDVAMTLRRYDYDPFRYELRIEA